MEEVSWAVRPELFKVVITDLESRLLQVVEVISVLCVFLNLLLVVVMTGVVLP